MTLGQRYSSIDRHNTGLNINPNMLDASKGRTFDVLETGTVALQFRDRIITALGGLLLLGYIDQKSHVVADVVAEIIKKILLSTDLNRTSATWTREVVIALQQRQVVRPMNLDDFFVDALLWATRNSIVELDVHICKLLNSYVFTFKERAQGN
jgi:hypothetical protein